MFSVCTFKVHLTSKYFFCPNKSLHLFETHCAFLLCFNPNLDFLQALKVTKSGHHQLHDRASKEYGSVPGWMSQTDLHPCLQRLIWYKSVCDVHTGIDPYPLLAQSCNRWWPKFITFKACKKSRCGLKWSKKALCVSNRCNDLFERKKYFGVRCTLIICNLSE